MALRYLTSGFDATANPNACITRAQLLQMIQAAIPYTTNKIGVIIGGTTSPNVTANPELAYSIWLKESAPGVLNGEIYYYVGGSWTLVSMTNGANLVNGTVTINKLSLSGVAVGDIIQIGAGSTWGLVNIINAITNDTLPIAKLVGGVSGNKVLTSVADSQAWSTTAALAEMFGAGEIAVTKLAGGGSGVQVFISTAGTNSIVTADSLMSLLTALAIPISKIAVAGGSALQYLRINAGANALEFGTPNQPYLVVYDVKGSGTAAQSLTTAAVWNVRTLNTKVDLSGMGTLAANQLSLPAGTYRVAAEVSLYPSGANGIHQIRLYNTTTSLPVLTGLNGSFASTIVGSVACARGVIVLASAAVLELQHRVTANCLGGSPTSFGDEVYAEMSFTKEI